MQSTFFFFGMVVSIGALAFHGLITRDHVRFALVLLPAVVFGILVSQPLAKRFSKRMVRPAALVFSGTAALILLAKILTN